MADVPEHFSDTAQEKSEANDVQMIASQKKRKEKGNFTCPFQVRVRVLIPTMIQSTSDVMQQNLIFTSFKN